MSAIDDILFAPIESDTKPGVIDQALIAQVALCLGDPHSTFSFSVNNRVSIDTYRRIAQIIQDDRPIFRHARQFCASDPFGQFRPKTALDIIGLFEKLHQNPNDTTVFWSCPGALTGVISISYLNHFSIINGMPTAKLSDGMDFEWWILGLMTNFAGSHGYYCFNSEQDAQKHWIIP